MVWSGVVLSALLVTAFARIPTDPRSDVVGSIKPPIYTDWGNWGAAVYCDPGTYVETIRLRYQAPQGSGDDTAVNRVALTCKYV